MGPPLLVVAQSARVLAASASRAGLEVRALDRFGDRDLRRLAPASEVVRTRAGDPLGFDREDLLAKARRLAPAAECPGLVYGAGFEDDVASLAALAQDRELLGNAPDAVARVKAPAELADLLQRLAIPHPSLRFEAPADPDGWLCKRAGSTGGIDVAAAGSPSPDRPGRRYYQRRVDGRNVSVLFLADARRARIVGVSRQFTRAAPGQPYLFAGAAGPQPIATAVRAGLQSALDRLVEATGLRGCNSADWIDDGRRWTLLEINPRPSATIALYDADWPSGLLDAHLRACRGELPPQPAAAGAPVRAFGIVFAEADLRQREVDWPSWCTDLPDGDGEPIRAGDPVCTVHGSGRDVAAAWRDVGARVASIAATLAGTGRLSTRRAN